MKQIAIYGKGGIGKSTLAAHVSAALGVTGYKILQVGCDPKHDSTRLLLGGRNITTVLDYLRDTPPDRWQRQDIVFSGFAGVCCAEAGGPEPGVGCAGRGILTAFDLLEKLGIMEESFDMVIYDVLGDVVCGGFAVPLRKEYADRVYIVTSGEFMSLYAANNILRGLANYDGERPRIAGLIYNQKGAQNDEARAVRFADAVGIPICAVIPYSQEFSNAEQIGATLVEQYGIAEVTSPFFKIAEQIASETILYPAHPLSPDSLESMVLERTVCVSASPTPSDPANQSPTMVPPAGLKHVPAGFMSLNVRRREPLHGCAFNGAVNITVHLQDAVTVAHGPRSCAHASYQTITSAARKSVFERGVVLPVQLQPPLVSSDMHEGVMIFGGVTDLQSKVLEVMQQNPAAIFVVTTCPAGIIGDNLDAILALDQPRGVRVIPLAVDGNITGDYLQGMILAYVEIARRLIDREVKPEPDLVNIIGEKTIATVTDRNLETMTDLLSQLGVKVNCRFICQTSVAEVRQFKKAPLNLLAYNDYMGRLMRDFLSSEFNAAFLPDSFPTGFHETAVWLEKCAAYFGREGMVESIIQRYREIYERSIAELKPILSGKRLMVVTYNHDIDWILEPALDVGMEIVQVGILNYSQDNLFRSRFAGRFPLVEKYPQEQRLADIQKYQPDIFLSNHTLSHHQTMAFSDAIPLCPFTGFFSGLDMARRWANLFALDLNEEWKQDEALFRKYLA